MEQKVARGDFCASLPGESASAMSALCQIARAARRVMFCVALTSRLGSLRSSDVLQDCITALHPRNCINGAAGHFLQLSLVEVELMTHALCIYWRVSEKSPLIRQRTECARQKVCAQSNFHLILLSQNRSSHDPY